MRFHDALTFIDDTSLYILVPGNLEGDRSEEVVLCLRHFWECVVHPRDHPMAAALYWASFELDKPLHSALFVWAGGAISVAGGVINVIDISAERYYCQRPSKSCKIFGSLN
jgi:hypothetical protein